MSRKRLLQRNQQVNLSAYANDLTAVADRLGAVRAKIKLLQEEEAKLKQQIIESGKTKVEGNKYIIQVQTATKAIYDTEAIVKKLPKKHLKEVVTITAKIKNYIAPQELDKYTTLTEYKKIICKRK